MANKEPDDDKKFKLSGARKYFNIGVTAFLVIVCSLIFFFFLFRLGMIADFCLKILGILQPILFGLVFAYLLNPLVKRIESGVKKLLTGKKIGRFRPERASRGISIFIALLIVGLIIYFLTAMLIPGLVTSIATLASELPAKLDAGIQQLWAYLGSDETIAAYVNNTIVQITTYFDAWLRNDLLGQLQGWINIVASSVKDVGVTAMNLIIGLIVSVYVLSSKERFIGQIKKAAYTVLSERYANGAVELVRQANRIFGGYIIGKLISSACIGVVCFLGMTLFGMHYAVLISTIVAITNVIPFFGPYIGGVPSALLLILTDPMEGVYFIIFLIVLQQLEGNILEPKIVGSSLGLSAFWVIFAILLGGGLFGIVGLILGVPVLSLIFHVLGIFTGKMLKKKGLPEDSQEYVRIDRINEGCIDYIPQTKPPKRTGKRFKLWKNRKK